MVPLIFFLIRYFIPPHDEQQIEEWLKIANCNIEGNSEIESQYNFHNNEDGKVELDFDASSRAEKENPSKIKFALRTFDKYAVQFGNSVGIMIGSHFYIESDHVQPFFYQEFRFQDIANIWPR